MCATNYPARRVLARAKNTREKAEERCAVRVCVTGISSPKVSDLILELDLHQHEERWGVANRSIYTII
jgi:hypothetical protein